MATLVQKGIVIKPGTYIKMVMARKFNGSFRGVDFLLSDQSLVSLSNTTIKYVDGYGDGPREIIATCYVRFKDPNPIMCMNAHNEYVSYVPTPNGIDTIAFTSSGSMEDNTYEVNKMEFHKDGKVVGSMAVPSKTNLKQTETLYPVDADFEVSVWRNPDGMTWVVPVKKTVNPADGGWGNWSEWSSCIAGIDGVSVKTRKRECDSPFPASGGKPCSGSKLQTENCIRSDGPENSTVSKPAYPRGEASPNVVIFTQTQKTNYTLWMIVLIALVCLGMYAVWPTDSSEVVGGMDNHSFSRFVTYPNI